MSDKNFRDSGDSVILYIILASIVALIFFILPKGSYHLFGLLFWPVILIYAIFKKKK